MQRTTDLTVSNTGALDYNKTKKNSGYYQETFRNLWMLIKTQTENFED